MDNWSIYDDGACFAPSCSGLHQKGHLTCSYDLPPAGQFDPLSATVTYTPGGDPPGNCNGTGSSTINLAAIADSHIRETSSYRDSNYGGLTRMEAKTWGGAIPSLYNNRRALVRFDVKGQLPARAVVQNARLCLTVDFQTGWTMNIDVHRLLTDWTEMNVTWNAPWDISGGDYEPTPSDTPQTIGANTWPGTEFCWDVSADAQHFNNHPEQDFGWLLRHRIEALGGEYVLLATKENSNTDYRPRLEVTFCDGTGAGVGGSPETVGQVADSTECAAGGWYYDDPTDPQQIRMCPNTCAEHQGDAAGRIDIAFGCGGDYQPTIYSQVYEAQCSAKLAGVISQWGFMAYETTTPQDSRISFEVRTADDLTALNDEDFIQVANAEAGSVDTQDCPMAGPEPCPIDLFVALGEGGAHKRFLEVRTSLTPNAQQTQTPTLHGWRVTYSCPPKL